MILYTDLNIDYFHLCTNNKERISWLYKTWHTTDFLHCAYSDCEFRFPKLFVMNVKAYNVYHIGRYHYLSFKSTTNNKGYLESLQKIEV